MVEAFNGILNSTNTTSNSAKAAGTSKTQTDKDGNRAREKIAQKILERSASMKITH